MNNSENNESNYNNNSSHGLSRMKRIIILILSILIMLLLTVSISFAVYRAAFSSSTNSISTGDIKMSYIEATNGISLSSALPVNDSYGMSVLDKGSYFDFSISSSSSSYVEIPYEISISEEDLDNKLDDKYIKVYLTKIINGVEEKIMEPVNLGDLQISSVRDNAKVLYNSISISDKNTYNKVDYRLRMWIDYEADVNSISNKSFSMTINVDGR